MSTCSPQPTATDPVADVVLTPQATLRRSAANARGQRSEDLVAELLAAEGYAILGRRVRTPVGEIDLIAGLGGLVCFVEVKQRRRLADAAVAISPAQRRRIVAAAEYWLARNPEHGRDGARFDVVVVDAERQARRIADAFRVE